MLRRRDKERAFTLFEVMIIVALISILALIIVPRLLAASRRGREAALHENLQQLRQAIQRFEGDTGAFPPALTDLIVATGAAISAPQDGAGISVDQDGYRGPYLYTEDGSLPTDPFTNAADWHYDNATGEHHSASRLTALNGESTYDT